MILPVQRASVSPTTHNNGRDVTIKLRPKDDPNTCNKHPAPSYNFWAFSYKIWANMAIFSQFLAKNAFFTKKKANVHFAFSDPFSVKICNNAFFFAYLKFTT